MSAKDRSLRRWKRIRRICCRIDVAALRLMARELTGKDGRSTVATLVERTSSFLILAPLTGRDSITVGQAVIVATGRLAAAIRRSLVWDCGTEMARR